MSFLLAAFALGMLLAQLQPWRPDLVLPVVLPLVPAAVALGVAGSHWRRWRLTQGAACLALAALGNALGDWAALQQQSRMMPRDAPDQVIEVSAWVSGLPQDTATGQHLTLDLLNVEATPGQPARASVTLTTVGRHALHRLQAGDCARFTLRLSPVHGLLNFTGFDSEAWSWASGIGASGSVQAFRPCAGPLWRQSPWAAVGAALQALRARLRQVLLDRLLDAPCHGILVALAVGDQTMVTAGQWSVLWRSGVGHLVSISGVHVTLLAGLLAAGVRRGWRHSVTACRWLPARRAGQLVAFAMALMYALVAGFAIPARRTLFMLAAASATQALGMQVGPGRVFWLAVVLTLLGDPFAGLSPSFWMSFAAVGGLILADWGRADLVPAWRQEWQAQWVANLALLPLIALWFGQFSLVSPVANVLAIPVVSLVVMPLTLVALIPGLSVLAWVPEWVCERLLDALTWLAQPAWACMNLAQPAPWVCLLCGAAVLWLLVPIPLPGRGWAWLTLVPLLWPVSTAPGSGSARVEVVDVGQGLSVLVRTANHALLFDTGPRWPGGDTGARTLLPLLQAAGLQRLDRLVLSHPDADHVGGAASLLSTFPVDRVLAGFARSASTPCLRDQRWQWEGVQFDMLYPVTPPAVTVTGSHDRNNHACVLRISVAGHAVLLPADIERPAEQELLALENGGGQLRSDVVVLAHHGSKTSSTAGFVVATGARWAIVSAGWRNHFHHPAPAVVARWQEAGADVLRTDQSGAIRITLDATGVHVVTARDARWWWWR